MISFKIGDKSLNEIESELPDDLLLENNHSAGYLNSYLNILK